MDGYGGSGDLGAQVEFTCHWLFCASGYYRYDEGYTPKFAGRDSYKGLIVHPQHWPSDLDCAGERVVVIGSGATAVTLVPALAKSAAHVTMLQRTPSYVLPVPSVDPLVKIARWVLSPARAHAVMRRKNVLQQGLIYSFCRRYAEAARRFIRWVNKRSLPAGYPVDTHFNPPYEPWDQRLCIVPDADLFESISAGEATVVTDVVETFTEHGVRLASGATLDAVIIITATGLNLLPVGGIALSVDGKPIELSDTIAFKGLMLSGVPNMCLAIGYANISWTLKIGLLCEHFCRILDHMDEHGYDACVPRVADLNMPTRPLLDFGAGYVKRSIDGLPRQGDAFPWVMPMQYAADEKMMRRGRVDELELHFSTVSDTHKAR